MQHGVKMAVLAHNRHNQQFGECAREEEENNHYHRAPLPAVHISRHISAELVTQFASGFRPEKRIILSGQQCAHQTRAILEFSSALETS